MDSALTRRSDPSLAVQALRLVRALLLPFGTAALIAIGVHAAADTVDDRLLLVVDRVQAAWDYLMGTWSLTSRWVDPLGLDSRVRVARTFTLTWELGVDWVLAVPLLGPARDDGAGFKSEAWRIRIGRAWSAGWLWLRPACTLALALAGSCSVATLVMGQVFIELQGRGDAESVSRLIGVVLLSSVAVVLGSRAVAKSLKRTQASSHDPARVGLVPVRGLWGTALALPLALAAVFDAAPIVGFFR